MHMNRMHRDSHEPVTGLGPKVERPAKPEPKPAEVAPGVFKGADGKLFTDIPPAPPVYASCYHSVCAGDVWPDGVWQSLPRIVFDPMIPQEWPAVIPGMTVTPNGVFFD